MNKFLWIYISLAAFALFFSCVNDIDRRCSEPLVCTEIFVSVVVEVVDLDANQVLLDSAKTIDDLDQSIFNANNSLEGKFYTIATDNDIDKIREEGSSLTFKGWIGSDEVLSEKYLIGKDCCHIEKITGPEKIVLDE